MKEVKKGAELETKVLLMMICSGSSLSKSRIVVSKALQTPFASIYPQQPTITQLLTVDQFAHIFTLVASLMLPGDSCGLNLDSH